MLKIDLSARTVRRQVASGAVALVLAFAMIFGGAKMGWVTGEVYYESAIACIVLSCILTTIVVNRVWPR